MKIESVCNIKRKGKHDVTGLSCGIKELNYKGLFRLRFQNVGVGRINMVAILTGFLSRNLWRFA